MHANDGESNLAELFPVQKGLMKLLMTQNTTYEYLHASLSDSCIACLPHGCFTCTVGLQYVRKVLKKYVVDVLRILRDLSREDHSSSATNKNVVAFIK